MNIRGNIVSVASQRIFPGEITLSNGRIESIAELNGETPEQYILPGFVDAHVHIESSMLVPPEFARLAVIHGTVATVSDPHEIANVMGVAGVEYMIENGKQVPFHFNYGAPSCVPATDFETAGARLDSRAVEQLLKRDEIKYLSEMMNYPGVLAKEPEVIRKIRAARKAGKPVDGHAPGLTGAAAENYIAAGITTDHECVTYEEARFKLLHGMKILIREGSAAKNFDALIPLLSEFPEHIMFCSDDKHPDDLLKGHINQLVVRALKLKIDLWKVLRAATLNPVLHYGLEHGMLRKGDSADLIVVNNLSEFRILQTIIQGIKVAENGASLIPGSNSPVINQFSCEMKKPADFRITIKETARMIQPGHPAEEKPLARMIEVSDGQLVTKSGLHPLDALLDEDGNLIADLQHDVLKLTVVNRYRNSPPAVALIRNMGIRVGAIASSVAHDCHNILATGVSDAMICKAVNAVIQCKGGLAVVTESEQHILALPVAGIMSNLDGFEISAAYEEIDARAKQLGTSLAAPFMTLSFMALLVIPELKLSDKGLFDGNRFSFVPIVDRS